MAEIERGCQYLKSLASILKMIEFVVLLIALGSVGYFFEKTDGSIMKKDTLKFFLFAVIVAWILVIVFFLTFLSGLHQRLSAINWRFTVVVIFGIWTIFLLIASALLADAVKSYEDDGFCAILHSVDAKEQCEHLIAGAVCGFIAMLLFVADSVIHFGMYTTSSPAASASVN